MLLSPSQLKLQSDSKNKNKNLEVLLSLNLEVVSSRGLIMRDKAGRYISGGGREGIILDKQQQQKTSHTKIEKQSKKDLSHVLSFYIFQTNFKQIGNL
jgi:hypothetical protein